MKYVARQKPVTLGGTAVLFIFHLFLISGICAMLVASSALAAPRGLTISPLRSEYQISPGTSINGTFRITNSTSQAMNVDLSAETFKMINEQYDYAFIDAASNGGEPAQWIRFGLQDLRLAANKSQDVKYQIAVPLKAEPGGRYISIFASSDTTAAGKGVASKQRIGSLLYVTVKGNVTRKGEMLGLATPRFTTKEIAWSARLRNSGTTHFRSKHTVTVKSVLDTPLFDKTGDDLILPGTVRLVSDTLSIKNPGIYKITYTIGLGDNPAHSETRLVWFAPVYVIVFIAIVILVTVLGVSQLLRSKKKQTNY